MSGPLYEPLPQPVEVPPEYRDGSLSEAFVQVLQRVHQTRAALQEEQIQRERAEDAAWARVVDVIDEARRHLARALDAVGPGAPSRRPVEEALTGLEGVLRKEELEIVDALGARLDDLVPGEFEILGSRRAEPSEEPGMVVEVWRKAVRRRGQLLRTGSIVTTEES